MRVIAAPDWNRDEDTEGHTRWIRGRSGLFNADLRSEGGETMTISMNTTSSRQMDDHVGNFSFEMRNKLAKVFERLSVISMILASRIAQHETQDREARQSDLEYEARKRKLLIALRNKISEKQSKTN